MSNETVDQTASNDQTVGESATGNTLLSSQNSVETSESDKTLLSSQEVQKVEGESKPEEKQEVVPEKYEAWKLPEGIELNPQMSEDFTTIAKELKLTQAQAQKLVDIQAKYANAAMDEAMANYKATTDGWKTSSIKEFGSNLNQELSYSRKALDTFGTPGLVKLLDETGLGNNPDVIRFCGAVGKLIGEDKFGEGQKRAPTKSVAEIFYPTMMKN